MAYQHEQAAPRLHVPEPHGIVIGAREGLLSIRAERVGKNVRALVIELEGVLCKLLARELCFRRWCWRPAGLEELRILLLTVRCQPIDIKRLREGASDRNLVEPQRNEAPLLVLRVAKTERARLQLRPLRAERIRRHTEHQHPGVFQPFLNLRRNAVVGLQNPLIEPHAQAIRPQPFCDSADNSLVLGAMAQEHVEGEFIAHGRQSEFRGEVERTCPARSAQGHWWAY